MLLVVTTRPSRFTSTGGVFGVVEAMVRLSTGAVAGWPVVLTRLGRGQCLERLAEAAQRARRAGSGCVAFRTPTTLASRAFSSPFRVVRFAWRRVQGVEQVGQQVAEQLAVARLRVGVDLDLVGLEDQAQQVQVDRRDVRLRTLVVPAGTVCGGEGAAGMPGICAFSSCSASWSWVVMYWTRF